MSILPPDRKFRNSAFSLVEMLMVVSAISMVATVAIFLVSDLGKGSKSRKLSAQISTLNSSLAVYEASGGDLSGLKDENEVILKLKKGSSNSEQIAGVRGSFVDPRLKLEKVAGSDERGAVWNPSTRRFDLADTGEGVRFLFDNSFGERNYGTEERPTNFDLATNDTWVWDYSDRTGVPVAPPNVMTSDGFGKTPTPIEPEAVEKLLMPDFSPKGGIFGFSEFDMKVFLLDPNPAGRSKLRYMLNGGSWQEYNGEAILLGPDSTLEAYAADATESGEWTDSERGTEFYQSEAVPLDVTLSFAKSSFTYQDLGGAMIPGSQSSEYVPASGVIRILNQEKYADYMSEREIELLASVGGIEVKIPMEPGSLTGYVSLDISHFKEQSSIVATARAVSHNNMFTKSGTVMATLNASQVKILSPMIEERPRPDGLFIYDEHYVAMTLDAASGDIPEGAVIYYTTDGSDPGESYGMPTSPTAKRYEKPFIIAQPDGQPIRARVYGPQGNERWFVTSDPDQIVWPLVASIGFEMTGSLTATSQNTSGSKPSFSGVAGK